MLLNKVCGVSAQPVSVGRRKVIQLTEPSEIAAVMEHMGYDFRSYITYHLNRNVIENDCCAAAFVRGMFLMAGSVAGPDKKSHLEIKTGHAILGREVMSLLLDLELMPKMIERRSTWLLYWKNTAPVSYTHLDVYKRQTMTALIDEARRVCDNLTVPVYAIQNDFFGHGVTVAGLITGQDLVAQLKGCLLYTSIQTGGKMDRAIGVLALCLTAWFAFQILF